MIMANKSIKLLFKSPTYFLLPAVMEYRLKYSLVFWSANGIIFYFLGSYQYRFDLCIFEYRFATLIVCYLSNRKKNFKTKQ